MDTLRLSDAEREEALARLRDAYAEGRLDKDEFDERTDALWTARTRADLDPLFADLAPGWRPGRPAYAGDPRGQGQYRGRRRHGRHPAGIPHRHTGPMMRRHGLPGPLVLVLVVLVTLTVLTHLPLVLLGLLVWGLFRFACR